MTKNSNGRLAIYLTSVLLGLSIAVIGWLVNKVEAHEGLPAHRESAIWFEIFDGKLDEALERLTRIEEGE